jgi:hypothetical protein
MNLSFCLLTELFHYQTQTFPDETPDTCYTRTPYIQPSTDTAPPSFSHIKFFYHVGIRTSTVTAEADLHKIHSDFS